MTTKMTTETEWVAYRGILGLYFAAALGSLIARVF